MSDEGIDADAAFDYVIELLISKDGFHQVADSR
jgi:hypothetical protein